MGLLNFYRRVNGKAWFDENRPRYDSAYEEEMERWSKTSEGKQFFVNLYKCRGIADVAARAGRWDVLPYFYAMMFPDFNDLAVIYGEEVIKRCYPRFYTRWEGHMARAFGKGIPSTVLFPWQYIQLHAKCGGKCTYCGVKVAINSRKKLHFDHIKPLAKGGTNSLDNLTISCYSCNSSKGAKLKDEWIRENAPQAQENGQEG